MLKSFLDGRAGTGKTFLYKTLLNTIRGKGNIVTPVDLTGIAATLLSGAKWAHSIFKIPVLLNTTSTFNIKPNSKEAQILLKTKLIIWDKAPMIYYRAFVADFYVT